MGNSLFLGSTSKRQISVLKPTKKHIADKALLLFNERGFVNIRLQHIADVAFVSVGHLAYHFKTKDAIIEYLYDELVTRQEAMLNQFRVVPLFEDLDRYFNAVYELQQEYIFIYLDLLELLRAHQSIREKHQQHLQWKEQQIRLMIDFNISRGAFVDMETSVKQHLIFHLRVWLDSWPYLASTSLQQKPTGPQFLEELWAVLAPYFSEMGKIEYQQVKAGY